MFCKDTSVALWENVLVKFFELLQSQDTGWTNFPETFEPIPDFLIREFRGILKFVQIWRWKFRISFAHCLLIILIVFPENNLCFILFFFSEFLKCEFCCFTKTFVKICWWLSISFSWSFLFILLLIFYFEFS